MLCGLGKKFKVYCLQKGLDFSFAVQLRPHQYLEAYFKSMMLLLAHKLRFGILSDMLAIITVLPMAPYCIILNFVSLEKRHR